MRQLPGAANTSLALFLCRVRAHSPLGWEEELEARIGLDPECSRGSGGDEQPTRTSPCMKGKWELEHQHRESVPRFSFLRQQFLARLNQKG